MSCNNRTKVAHILKHAGNSVQRKDEFGVLFSTSNSGHEANTWGAIGSESSVCKQKTSKAWLANVQLSASLLNVVLCTP
jgi:hypothetical protein